jgi:hypothetical protein
MRMGKKMRIISILMSITVIAATLGFATFALTQNSTSVNYDGSLTIGGNADIDVSIAFFEIGNETAQFSITADENGIVEKKGDTVVKTITDVKDVTEYGISTKPVLDPKNSYKFVVTINNPSPDTEGEAYVNAVVSVLNFSANAAFSDYYTIINPELGEGLIEDGASVSYTVFLNANSYNSELDYNNIEFTYNLNVIAYKA